MTVDDLVLTAQGLRFRGRFFPCSIGRGGIATTKQEGDGATPAGRYRIVGAYYRPDRMTRPVLNAAAGFKMTALRRGDIWSDDPLDPRYNHGLHAHAHPFGHERLWRNDHLYDLILLTNFNWPEAKPGKGSAIFLHVWRRPRFPTAGCVAFSKADLLWIIARLTRHSHLIVPEHAGHANRIAAQDDRYA